MKKHSINWLHLGKIFSPVILLLFLMTYMQLQANQKSDVPVQSFQQPILSSGVIEKPRVDHVKLVLFSADDDFSGIRNNKINAVYVKGIHTDVVLEKMNINNK